MYCRISIHPFASAYPFFACGAGAIPAVIGREAEYTLDRSPVCRRANTHRRRQPFALTFTRTFTPNGNLDYPINLSPQAEVLACVCSDLLRLTFVCVSPAPTAARSAPSTVSTNSADSTRVVMSVEEFYYGTFEGDLTPEHTRDTDAVLCMFNVCVCRLMQHMLQHSELINGGGDDDRKCCRFCYRQFSSDAQLQSHEDQVHGPTLSSCMCRICEWAFESEPLFLNHMKSNHKPGEMPYVVCSYRSSFYSDVLQHFSSFHRDSCFLLCIFCLKVTRNPVSYRCRLPAWKCRLQFVFLKDKMQHKLENHRSFRRPPQLEGLPPGSKVTNQDQDGATEVLIQKNPTASKLPRSPTKKLGSRRIHGNR
uniref:C2H2-type domain-containing protein n=1 Tax=Maylandia zebra TaxID=106582 RepID=A0A3P9DCD0_9CICH